MNLWLLFFQIKLGFSDISHENKWVNAFGNNCARSSKHTSTDMEMVKHYFTSDTQQDAASDQLTL